MLSLPGTEYDHVKIQCMGTSLARFINLRHIDLSLNALTSLRGLETLGQLEKLNIYHNNLTLLSELFRLHHNARLNEVDIRMNPVSLNEKDYRLFLIHLLPDLELLDDSKVWSSERMAAQLYFTKFSVQQPDKGHPVSTVVPPRVRLVQQVLRLTADPKGSIQQLPCSEGCSEQHCSNFKPIHASYSLCRNKGEDFQEHSEAVGGSFFGAAGCGSMDADIVRTCLCELLICENEAKTAPLSGGAAPEADEARFVRGGLLWRGRNPEAMRPRDGGENAFVAEAAIFPLTAMANPSWQGRRVAVSKDTSRRVCREPLRGTSGRGSPQNPAPCPGEKRRRTCSDAQLQAVVARSHEDGRSRSDKPAPEI
ncbi:PREDICTED: uncharacterized protein LOC106814800 [Priapulus caudatus]|uniref:Uncharacterized protein LOC106814800 n=1 Tax=Priapulus caudatus TaxID=37621 RepID=A0ABM1ER18_PRICU|nr:PREDICTED: uncharacterized protein LOC106814800 [Priapulus caudatus]